MHIFLNQLANRTDRKCCDHICLHVNGSRSKLSVFAKSVITL